VVIARIEPDDGLGRHDLGLEPKWKVECQGQRSEPTLRGETPGAKGSRQPPETSWIDLGCSAGESLGEALDTPREVNPERTIEERSLQCRAPGAPDGLGFEVDRLGPFNYDAKGSAADDPDANLVCACHKGSADGMAEQSELTQRAQVGNPVRAAFERCPDGEGEIVCGG
jgi:hypothetical protein